MTAPRPRKRSTARAKPGKARPVETGLDTVADPVELAKATLQDICRSDAPAAARAQAARTLLELHGALRVALSAEKSSSEMTLDEIDARLGALDADTQITDTSQTR